MGSAYRRTSDQACYAEAGSRLEKRVQELFSFQSKASWTKLNSQKVGNNQVYVFAYNKILKPQETTESLFDTVKFLNIIEGQLDGQQLEIPVRAYPIPEVMLRMWLNRQEVHIRNM